MGDFTGHQAGLQQAAPHRFDAQGARRRDALARAPAQGREPGAQRVESTPEQHPARHEHARGLADEFLARTERVARVLHEHQLERVVLERQRAGAALDIAGQVVARVGNNGYGRSPHIHIGAWKGENPYQIRWDLRSNARRAP